MDLKLKQLSMLLDKPVVMMGMMGCGKSHAGRLLAQDLDIQLYDIDLEIERAQGRKISDIFAKDGEIFFRKLECEMIKEKIYSGVSVISLGGGAVTTPEVLQEVLDHTISIWLDTDLETLFERTQRNNNRPLLQCDDPREKLQQLWDARKDLYARANYRIDSSGNDPAPVVRNIEKALYARYYIA